MLSEEGAAWIAGVFERIVWDKTCKRLVFQNPRRSLFTRLQEIFPLSSIDVVTLSNGGSSFRFRLSVEDLKPYLPQILNYVTADTEALLRKVCNYYA